MAKEASRTDRLISVLVSCEPQLRHTSVITKKSAEQQLGPTATWQPGAEQRYVRSSLLVRIKTRSLGLCNTCYACVYVHVVESINAVAQTALEDSLSETLEKEVQETRKMVSALQVWRRG